MSDLRETFATGVEEVRNANMALENAVSQEDCFEAVEEVIRDASNLRDAAENLFDEACARSRALEEEDE